VLIHSIDVMDSNDGQRTLAQMPGWKGAADIIALDPYPCHQDGRPCQFDWIDTVVARADAAGLPYWGVVQAFGDPPGTDCRPALAERR
jgi:hypothetical protein